MISGIRLKNFRGYRHGEIELKPLTVLLGPNNAGKSSFLHALVGLAQYHRLFSSLRPNLARPLGVEDSVWPIDLGTYETLIHQDENGECQNASIVIAVRTECGWVEYAFGGEPGTGLEVTGFRIAEEVVPQVASANAMPASEAQIQTGAGDVAAYQYVEGEPGTLRDRVILTEYPDTVFEGVTVAGSAAPQHVATVFDAVKGKGWFGAVGGIDTKGAVTLDFSGLIVRQAALLETGFAVSFPSRPLVMLAQDLEIMTYLMPCRERPRREWEPCSDVRPLMPSGQWIATKLRAGRAGALPAISVAEPPPLSDQLDGPVELRAWTKAEMSLLDAVGGWMQRFDLAQGVEVGDSAHRIQLRARMAGGAVCDFADIGFGSSQLLPILVAGLSLPPGGMLVVEQPESQLHPKAQSVLGDFFCSLIKSGRQVLIETHSQPLIDRLRLHIAMDLALQEFVNVYAIDQPCGGQCAEPRQVLLTEEGEMSWPAGFLGTGVEEEVRIGLIRQQTHGR